MPCVSDNGATAPISALTYAFSIGSDRGMKADDSEARIIAGRAKRRPRVNRIDKPKGEARHGIHAVRDTFGLKRPAEVVNRIDDFWASRLRR
jgi:hypothetical protein